MSGARIGPGAVTFSNAPAPVAMVVLGGLSDIVAGSRRQLTMQLTDAMNQPVARTSVSLNCLDPCRGRELPLSLRTDATGQAVVPFQVDEKVRSVNNRTILNLVQAQVGRTRVIYRTPTVPDRRGARQLRISGRLVEADPGKPLARPLVVAVRDQFGNPFQGVLVQASVTEGRGTLSLSDTSEACLVQGSATVQGVTEPTGRAVALTDANGEVRFDLTVNEFSNGQLEVETAVPEVETNRLVFRVVRSQPQVGNAPRGVAVADIDADGNIDIITANAGDDNVSILFGNGDGSVQDQTATDIASGPVAIEVADLNADGDLDIVTANVQSNDVSILINLGNGQFGTLRN